MSLRPLLYLIKPWEEEIYQIVKGLNDFFESFFLLKHLLGQNSLKLKHFNFYLLPNWLKIWISIIFIIHLTESPKKLRLRFLKPLKKLTTFSLSDQIKFLKNIVMNDIFHLLFLINRKRRENCPIDRMLN